MAGEQQVSSTTEAPLSVITETGTTLSTSDATTGATTAAPTPTPPSPPPAAGPAATPTPTPTADATAGFTPSPTGAASAAPAPVNRPRVGSWTTAAVVFAGSLMLMVGMFHVLAGTAAIARDKFFVVNQNYFVTLDVTAWGWIHLGYGLLVAVAGAAVFTGAAWARTTAILLAGISIVTNFLFLPYYPLWALVIITFDVLVIRALVLYDENAAVL